MSTLTPCVLSPPQVCRLPTESTYSPTPLLKLIHVWCKNARSDPGPSRSQESKKSRRIGFCSEISVLLHPGIFPSWPNEKPTSWSAMSSATFLHSSWQRTRPRRLSPWWWTRPSLSPPQRILSPRKQRQSWASTTPSSLSHKRAVWSWQVGINMKLVMQKKKIGLRLS